MAQSLTATRALTADCVDGPLVTVGVPVYRGHELMPGLLDCLLRQTYRNLDIMISVDGADAITADACRPFLSDARVRLEVQPKRLGWAGNTDRTLRGRRGDFYTYQQHDDLVSPSYIADLVAAARQWPQASICYSEMKVAGPQNVTVRDRSLLGAPLDRVMTQMERMNVSMLRGLIRGSALDATRPLRLNEYEGYGSDQAFLAELALAGEFRFVEGPTYYKNLHGRNLHMKWQKWSDEQKRGAWICLGAWMAEIIVPWGETCEERWRLFLAVLDRFLIARGILSWLRRRSTKLHDHDFDRRAAPLRTLLDLARKGGHLDRWVADRSRYMFCHTDRTTRGPMLRAIIRRLEDNGELDPRRSFAASWPEVEARAARFLGLAAPAADAPGSDLKVH